MHTSSPSRAGGLWRRSRGRYRQDGVRRAGFSAGRQHGLFHELLHAGEADNGPKGRMLEVESGVSGLKES